MPLHNQVKIIDKGVFTSNTDAIVIPCSTDGFIFPKYMRGLSKLMGIPTIPSIASSPLGSIQAIRYKNPHGGRTFLVLFATCMDNKFDGSYNSIEKIAKELATFNIHSPDVTSIAMPLLSLELPNLDSSRVLDLLDGVFLKSLKDLLIEIYIEDFEYEQLVDTTIRKPRDKNLEMQDQLMFQNDFEQHQFYFVGDPDGNNLMFQEFLDKGIWINTRPNYDSLVNSIPIGSVLFLKTNKTAQGNYIIIIRAIGIVKANHKNKTLDVDWSVRNLKLQISTDHHFRNTVTKIGKNKIQEILKKIGRWKTFRKLLFGNQIEHSLLGFKKTASKIAGLDNDADYGDDHLEIQHDVTSFAKIIAAKSLIPPLSVALFGNWGAGKSFFMKKLDFQIEEYSTMKNQQAYCNGIAQIHFNAWSYMDANLWASLVSKIFEGLYKYIKSDEVAKGEIKEITDTLNKQLTIVSEELDKIQGDKSALEQKLARFESEKSILKNKLASKIASIEKGTFKETLLTIDGEFKVSDELSKVIVQDGFVIESVDEIKKVVPEVYWSDPALAYEKARSIATFLREFFRKENLWINLGVISLVLLLIVSMPFFIKESSILIKRHILPQIQWVLYIATLGIPFWKRLSTTWEKVGPIISAFWKVKEDHKRQIEIAKVELLGRESAIKLEIEMGSKELEQLETKIQLTTKSIHDLNFKLNHAIATEALYSFIEKRCNSDEYQKHLGIVSIIRKDFEVLSGLFLNHNKEIVTAEAETFKKMFKYPLERIVLYIDDLDRCPEDRVVEVLEAVNLLMAFPLFVVVVGVDPRWVRQALAHKYQNQFMESRTVNDSDISAFDYLEKIFQVPFHLQQASDSNVKLMLRNLTFSLNIEDSQGVFHKIEENEKSIKLREIGKIDLRSLSSEENVNQPVQRVQEHLELSLTEAEMIQGMSGVLGNNPRTIKRYVNIYKIVRAHEGLTYQGEQESSEFLIIMFLLALSTGRFRKLAKGMHKYLKDDTKMNESFSNFFLNVEGDTPEITLLKQQLDQIVKDLDRKNDLYMAKNANYRHHNEFIRRFTFDDNY